MTSNEKSDVILLKFLKAKEFRVQDSYNMLDKCLSWRKNFGVDSIVGQDLGFKELEGVVSYFNGFDKDGHPIWWNNNYGIFKNKKINKKFLGDNKKVEKFIKWKIQVLETGILKMLDFSPGGVNSITEVYDATDLPPQEYTFVCERMLPLFNNYYPGIVEFKIVINARWFFRKFVFSIFNPFMTNDTKKGGCVVCKEENVAETLYRYISPEYVPIQYGGMRGPDELNNSPAKAATEFIVQGEEKVIIPIEGIKAGEKIIWDVVVGGWDLKYRALFVPDDAASKSYDHVVEKRKMLAMPELVHNSYVAKEAGKLVLTINNTASRKKKVGAYRYLVQKSNGTKA
ncbi:patellin-6 [Tanacetum coccineum]